MAHKNDCGLFQDEITNFFSLVNEEEFQPSKELITHLIECNDCQFKCGIFFEGMMNLKEKIKSAKLN